MATFEFAVPSFASEFWVTLLISALIVVFSIKYRRRHENEVGKDIGEHHWLEWTWSLVPLGIMLCVFVWAGDLYVRMAKSPGDAFEIHVIGKSQCYRFSCLRFGHISVERHNALQHGPL